MLNFSFISYGSLWGLDQSNFKRPYKVSYKTYILILILRQREFLEVKWA